MSLLSNTILINGAIYTVDLKSPWAQAIVISHDTIHYIGTNKEALGLRKSDSKIIDLNGSLEVGKKADLVVLDHNPFASEMKEIHTFKAQTTMINGKVVFDRSRLLIR